MSTQVAIGLNAVIVAVTEEMPRILTVWREGAAGEPAEEALPFGPLEPETDRTLDRGLRRWVREQTGLDLGYVEQLYTFGDRNRYPGESRGGPREVSVAYLALVREVSVGRGASWRDGYEFFPWEDWRSGRPAIIEGMIAPALRAWIAAAPDTAGRLERRERVEIVFGLSGAPWDGERVLERYELLYEAYLVPEAWRDREATGGAADERRPVPPRRPELLPGRVMALDHRRILATALGRLRGKLKYRPVVFELLPPSFTLLQIQRVVEALAGVRLHKQNFRRLVENAGLVEGTGLQDAQTGGRPAELFVFRREVLRERPAPGVGLPGVRRG
ncbi:MAG TPA: hypothetical protein VKK31_14520 [Thermoanaerobaculia bacterium]|nr:hypothetical protein [Thermoanaerobaculia bacterium]